MQPVLGAPCAAWMLQKKKKKKKRSQGRYFLLLISAQAQMQAGFPRVSELNEPDYKTRWPQKGGRVVKSDDPDTSST